MNKPSYKVRDEIFKNLNNKEVVENFNERISGYFLMIQLINTLNAAADVEDHKSAKIIAKAIGNTKVKVFKVKNLNPEIKSIIIKYNIKNSGLLLNNISYMTEQINNKYKRKLQDAQKIQWHSIWDSFLIWLIPMIILYLLGEGINWVRKGFKKSSQ